MSKITLYVDANIRIRPVFQQISTPPPVTPPPVAPPAATPPPVTPPPVRVPVSPTPSVTSTPAISETPEPSVTPSITSTPGASLTQTPAPSITPSITRTPSPSQTPGVTRTPGASVTPSATPLASVTPTVSQTYWRSCVDGNLRPGTPPGDFVKRVYPLGGACWEPGSQVGFEPELSQALRYEWKRGSRVLPEARTVKVTNPSSAATYTIGLLSDPDIIITPNNFTIGPRESKNFVVNVTQQLLNRLADGLTDLALRVELREL